MPGEFIGSGLSHGCVLSSAGFSNTPIRSNSSREHRYPENRSSARTGDAPSLAVSLQFTSALSDRSGGA